MMNKGLEIRDKKRQRKSKKRATIKNNQKGKCRFVCFLNPETGMRNGKACFLGRREIRGLQIENKLFYIDCGIIKQKFINKQGGKILEIYTLEEALNSNFVNEELIKKYNDFKSTETISPTPQ